MSLTTSYHLSCTVLHNICLYNGKDNNVIENYINKGTASIEGEGDIEYAQEGEDEERNVTQIRSSVMLEIINK